MSDHKSKFLRLELGALIALDALLQERSVSKAAQRVGTSQPTMSHLLARLRATFDDVLLVRGRSGMVLTENAEVLREHLVGLIPQIDDFGRAGVFAPDTSHSTFRLACTEHAALVLLPRLQGLLDERAPDATLKVLSVHDRTLDFQRLEKSHFDLLVGVFSRLPADWHVVKLYEERLVVIGGRMLRKGSQSLSVERFLAAKHVAFSPDERTMENMADVQLASKGLKRNIGTYVAAFSTSAFIVARSNCLAIIPAGLAAMFAHLPGIKILPSPVELPSFPVSMAWHPRAQKKTEHRWFRQLVAEAMRQPALQQ